MLSDSDLNSVTTLIFQVLNDLIQRGVLNDRMEMVQVTRLLNQNDQVAASKGMRAVKPTKSSSSLLWVLANAGCPGNETVAVAM